MKAIDFMFIIVMIMCATVIALSVRLVEVEMEIQSLEIRNDSLMKYKEYVDLYCEPINVNKVIK